MVKPPEPWRRDRSVLYCAYGSNLHLQRLRGRVPSAELRGWARIPGWSLRFHKIGRDGSGKCNIIRAAAQSFIYGAVFEFDREELYRLDRAESLGTGYHHHPLEVPGFGTALTYRAYPHAIAEGLLPYHWYKEYVLLGCEQHDFEASYIEAIRQHPHGIDPDRKRHHFHIKRIRKIRIAPTAADFSETA